MQTFKLLLQRTETYEKIIDVKANSRADAVQKIETLLANGWEAVAGDDDGDLTDCSTEVREDVEITP